MNISNFCLVCHILYVVNNMSNDDFLNRNSKTLSMFPNTEKVDYKVQALLSNVPYFFSKSTNVPYREPLLEKIRDSDPNCLIKGPFEKIRNEAFFTQF